MPVQPTILLAAIAFRGKRREQSRSCENVVIPKSAQNPYPQLGRQNGIYLNRTRLTFRRFEKGRDSQHAKTHLAKCEVGVLARASQP